MVTKVVDLRWAKWVGTDKKQKKTKKKRKKEK